MYVLEGPIKTAKLCIVQVNIIVEASLTFFRRRSAIPLG